MFRRRLPELMAVAAALLAVVLMGRAIVTDSWTYDERLHVQSAMEWASGVFSPSDPVNPPLTKLSPIILRWFGYQAELDPFLIGPRLASIGITLLLAWSIWWWVERRWGRVAAGVSAGLFLFEPLVLAHGHLYTTDIYATLAFFWVMVAGIEWVQTRRDGWLIATVLFASLAVATKITLLPMVALGLWLLFWWHQAVLEAVAAVLRWPLVWLLPLVIVWASYGFAFAPPAVGWPPLPLGGFMRSLLTNACFTVCDKYASSRTLFYFGEIAGQGWWSYPLVSFVVKTSPMLLLGFTMLGTLRWRTLRLLLAPMLSVALIVVAGRYSVGARHLLPLYPFLAIGTALIIQKYWRSLVMRAAVLVLVLGQLIHLGIKSDYIGYINLIFPSEYVRQTLADSNTDWGQGAARTATEYPELDFYALSTSYYHPQEYGLTGSPLPLVTQLTLEDVRGKTVAIGLTPGWLGGYFTHPLFQDRAYAVAAEGSVRVYRFEK